MKEIVAYQCQCGEIHKNKEDIFACAECGKEVCLECCGFEEGLCWDCNDKKIKEQDKVKYPLKECDICEFKYCWDKYGDCKSIENCVIKYNYGLNKLDNI